VTHFAIDEVLLMAKRSTDRWARPETILVATDLDDLERLAPFVMRMAAETGARLLLLHVLLFEAEYAVDACGLPYYNPDEAYRSASSQLDSWCKRARRQGINCEGIVRGGHAAAGEIVAAARQFEADRIFLGTRSRGKLGKLLLGSVAKQVLRSVTLPVFTVGPEAHLSASNSNHKPTILFATSLGEGHQTSAALACQIAHAKRARLVQLHVLPALNEKGEHRLPDHLDSTVLHVLTNLAHLTGADCALEVQSKISHGVPADEILAEAKACDADLIVLGVARHGVIDSILRDHTIDRILAHSSCPVLTLRQSMPTPKRREIPEMAALG
jgi:nucleotide-binding universal stress UspA family protein